jgi:hypothetical protein
VTTDTARGLRLLRIEMSWEAGCLKISTPRSNRSGRRKIWRLVSKAGAVWSRIRPLSKKYLSRLSSSLKCNYSQLSAGEGQPDGG